MLDPTRQGLSASYNLRKGQRRCLRTAAARRISFQRLLASRAQTCFERDPACQVTQGTTEAYSCECIYQLASVTQKWCGHAELGIAFPAASLPDTVVVAAQHGQTAWTRGFCAPGICPDSCGVPARAPEQSTSHAAAICLAAQQCKIIWCAGEPG